MGASRGQSPRNARPRPLLTGLGVDARPRSRYSRRCAGGCPRLPAAPVDSHLRSGGRRSDSRSSGRRSHQKGGGPMSKPRTTARPTGFPFFRSAVVEELTALRRSWGWLVGWGVLLIVGGGAALTYPTATTVVAVEVFAILLLLSGVGQFVAVFYARGWAGMLGAILCGLLYLFAGVVLFERPLLGAAGYTLFLTMLFFAVGVVRVASAII